MVTNCVKVVCPKCNDVNNYIITNMQLIDNDLHVSYYCETCGAEYTDIFSLVYIGGHMLTVSYDRDNIATAQQIIK